MRHLIPLLFLASCTSHPPCVTQADCTLPLTYTASALRTCVAPSGEPTDDGGVCATPSEVLCYSSADCLPGWVCAPVALTKRNECLPLDGGP